MSIDINTAWEELRARVATCTKCALCATRKNTVFGEGPVQNCRCVIIGEAPGEDEDKEGRPFVGKAGQLLTGILENGGKIPRDSVYIMNVLKCRPPDPETTNRKPSPEEMAACNEHLEAQLALLHPDIVVTMGATSTQWLMKTKQGITSLRGKWQKWRGIDLLPMFHPSYLLRTERDKSETGPKFLTWKDVEALAAKLKSLQ